MIKLIATDMDGTLLDENGELPKDFLSVVDTLSKNDIKFVVASGRSYPTLHDIFQPISDELSYICDNGAFIVENKSISSMEIIAKEDVCNIINVCEEIPNIQVTLCGKKGMYQTDCSDEFNEEIDKYYIKKNIVEDLRTVEDDIFKIAICDFSDAYNNSYKILESKFGDDFSVVVSGALWVDIMNKNINKGIALEKIQEDLNVSYEETMVFGDFYNDVEMLKRAHYSFVMENANEDMKQYGNFIAKSNRESGVTKAIKEYVLDKIQDRRN